MEPIKVSANAGLVDSVQAALRYVVVLVTFVTAVLALLKTRDIAGLISYIQSHGGEVLGAVSGLIALGTAAYGVFKSHKRGDQVAAVASSSQVPESVASLK
jgi:hypothetical protein